MRRLLIAAIAAALIAIPATAFANNGNGAGGVSDGGAFYVDGDLYRTVGTPSADFRTTGAPEHSFDTIYAIDGQPNVATAAPGYTDYNGGRWLVEALTFSDYEAAVAAVDSNGSGDLDTTQEVHDAMATQWFVDSEIVDSFECPVIPLPGGHS